MHISRQHKVSLSEWVSILAEKAERGCLTGLEFLPNITLNLNNENLKIGG